jgi:hypothetical protein
MGKFAPSPLVAGQRPNARVVHWWRQEGSQRYTGSRQLLILATAVQNNPEQV